MYDRIKNRLPVKVISAAVAAFVLLLTACPNTIDTPPDATGGYFDVNLVLVGTQTDGEPVTEYVNFTETAQTITVDVSYLLESIDIQLVDELDGATIKVNGYTISTDSKTTVTLETGTNPITVKVTPNLIDPFEYTLKIKKETPPGVTLSDDAALSSLIITPQNDTSINPVFAGDVFDYAVTASSTVTQITVTAELSDENADIWLNGDAIESGEELGPFELEYGQLDPPLVITTLAEDEIAAETYTLNVFRLSTEDNEDPEITLIGDNPYQLEVYSIWEDPGFTAYDAVYGDLTNIVEVTDNVNESTLGSYSVAYAVSDPSGNLATAQRTVNVVDTTPPEVEITGDNPMKVDQHADFSNLDPGATVTDNYDTNITITTEDDINTSVLGTYSISYTAVDDSGNSDTETRIVVVSNENDSDPPVLTLYGDNPCAHEVNTPWTDPGYNAYDDFDGNLTHSVDITGTIDVTTLGDTTLYYDVSDSSGNDAVQLSRLVTVEDTTAPEVTLAGSADMTIAHGSTFTDPGATATDNYDSSWTIYGSGTVPENTVGNYTLSYTATDSEGNVSATVTRTVHVTDQTRPVITIDGGNTRTVAHNSSFTDPYDLGQVTASDNVVDEDGDHDITYKIAVSGDSVDTSTTGTYHIYYDVTDSAGLAADTVVLTVTVTDLNAPTITLTGGSTYDHEVNTAWTDPGYSAWDEIDGTMDTADFDITGSVNTSALGDNTLTYSITDSSGNTASMQRTVTVQDTTSPVITLSGSNPMRLDLYEDYVEPGASVTDNFDTGLSCAITGSVDTYTTDTYQITYYVIDSSGNETTVVRNVVVSDVSSDDVVPVITLSGDNPMDHEVNTSWTEPGWTATDNIDGNISASVVVTNTVNTTALGPNTLYYDVSDSSGNAAVQRSRTVEVVDTTDPEIVLYGDSSITIAHGGNPYTDPGARVIDNYDIERIVYSSTTVNTNAVGTYTPVYTASDSSGNTAIPIYRTVYVTDQTPPVISISGGNTRTIAHGDPFTDPYDLGQVTASDIVDGDITVDIVISGDTVDTSTVGTYTILYNVADDAGNNAESETITITVEDRDAPTITLVGLASMTVEVDGDFTDPGANVTDNWDEDRQITSPDSVNTAILGDYTLTYNATDAAGNDAAEVTRTVSVVDTTIPVITLSGGSPYQHEVNTAWSDPGSTVTDNYYTGLTATVTGTVNTGALGSTTLYYNASDGSSNAAAQVNRIVNVVDTTAPTLTLNGNSVMTIAQGSGFSDPGADFSDNFDADRIEYSLDAVDDDVVDTYTLTYTANDTSGNSAVSITRTVHVTDQTAPVITITGGTSLTLDLEDSFTDPYDQGNVTALDNVDGDMTAQIVTSGDTVDTSTVGTYVIEYDVTDTAGNSAVTATYTVTVEDNIAPVINLSGDAEVTLEVGTAYNDPGANVTDNYDNSRHIYSPDTVDHNTVDVYTLRYNADDAAGNSAVQVTRTVNIVDTTDPVLTLNGSSPVTLQCGDTYTSSEDAGVTATDNYDTGIAGRVVTTGLPVDTSEPGTFTIRYNVTDSEGNAATEVTRTVEVIDTTPPVITLNGSAELWLEYQETYIEQGATATDNRDGSLPVTIGGETVTTDTLGTYVVTYNAEDANGNTADEVTRTVYVEDNTAPVITLTGDATVYVECGVETYSEPGATASDNYDGDISGNIERTGHEGIVNTVPGVSYTVEYDVADSNGNAAATVSRTVTIRDITPPSLALVDSSTAYSIEVLSNWSDWEVLDPGITATDNDARVDQAYIDAEVTLSGLNFNTVSMQTLTYTLLDPMDNSSTIDRAVNVVDTTAPVISLEGTTSMTIDVGSTFVDAAVTATDGYDGDISGDISKTGGSDGLGGIDTGAEGTYTIYYDVDDSSGNHAAQRSRTVTVEDLSAPVITVLGNDPVILCFSTYGESEDAGATALDNLDGDVTADIITTGLPIDTSMWGEYTVTYEVTDDAGYTATATRTVNVIDINAPVITLTGNASMTIAQDSTWTDPGATATDDVDGDISGNIAVTGSVNTATTGTYYLFYNVSDSYGNAAAQKIRVVTVE